MNENIVYPINPISDMDLHIRHYIEIKSKIKKQIKVKNDQKNYLKHKKRSIN